MLAENDISTALQADMGGSGFGSNTGGSANGGSISNQLSAEGNQTPPIYVPPTAAAPAESNAPVASTPAVVPASTTPAPAGAPVLTSGFWAGLKDKLGSAQTAVTSPVQSGLTSAAKAVGATDSTASTIGSFAGWVVAAVLVGIAGTVYVLRHRIFSHKITL
jgi:hypothetical protein